MSNLPTEPENIDLILSPLQMEGGNPAKIIEAMKVGVQNKSLNDKNTGEPLFEFTAANTQHRGMEGHFLGKGGLTAVFEVIRKGDHIPLILKVSSSSPIDEEYLRTEYVHQKELFGKIIPDIYYYGTVYLPDGSSNIDGRPMKYTIVKKYGDENVFLALDYEKKYEFLKKVVDILTKVTEHGYTWRDMKYPNIGIDEDGDPMIIDYDEVTIIPTDRYRDRVCERHCAGTYLPNFMIYDLFEGTKRDNLDKLAVMGLFKMILKLFYPDQYRTLSILLSDLDTSQYTLLSPIEKEQIREQMLEAQRKHTTEQVLYILKELSNPALPRGMNVVLKHVMGRLLPYKIDQVWTYPQIRTELDKYPPRRRRRERRVQPPAQPPVEIPVERPAERPVQRPAERPVQRPAERPVQRPAQPGNPYASKLNGLAGGGTVYHQNKIAYLQLRSMNN